MRLAAIWIVLFLLVMCGPLALALDTSWVAKGRAGKQALEQQQFAQAEALFREARNEAIQAAAVAHERGECDFNLAHVLLREGKFNEAELLWKSAIEDFTRTWGPNCNRAADALDGLGLTYEKQGRYTEAEQALRQSLDIKAKVYPGKPIAQAPILADLAQVLKNLGRYDDAQAMAEMGVDIVKKNAPPDDEAMVRPLNILASTLEQKGEYAKATPLFEECLRITLRVRGENSWQTATLLGNLALNYFYCKRFSDSEPLYQRILAIDKKLYGGTDHPSVAVTYNNLAMLNLSLGKYKEAEEQFTDAFMISQRAVGRNSPKTTLYLSNLGRVYLEVNRLSDANKVLTESVQAYEQTLGTNCADLIWPLARLGNVAYFEKDYKKSAAMFERAIAIAQVHWPSTHPDWSYLNSGLALVKTKEASLSNPNLNWSQALGVSNTKKITNTPIRDKWALVIGVSKYGTIKGANNFAQNGAELFYNYLTKNAGFKADHVMLLTDAQATRENIMSAMGDNFLPRNAKPDDLVVIYIATHGSTNDYDVGHLNYLLAYNTVLESPYATAIPLQYISRTVAERIPAKRAVIVVESCHSGAATNGPRGIDAAALAQGSGQMVLASSLPEQESIAWQNISPIFTYSLVQGLVSKGKETTLQEGFAYAQRQVPQYVARFGKTQTPMMVCGWHGEQLKLAQ